MLERILITGGGRFIGSHLAKYLLQQGNFVRIVDITFLIVSKRNTTVKD